MLINNVETEIPTISFKMFCCEERNSKVAGKDVGQRGLFILSCTQACLHAGRNIQ